MVQHKENDQIRPDNLNFEEDLTLKAEAFEKDLKLPLSGAEVHITSYVEEQTWPVVVIVLFLMERVCG